MTVTLPRVDLHTLAKLASTLPKVSHVRHVTLPTIKNVTDITNVLMVYYNDGPILCVVHSAPDIFTAWALGDHGRRSYNAAEVVKRIKQEELDDNFDFELALLAEAAGGDHRSFVHYHLREWKKQAQHKSIASQVRARIEKAHNGKQEWLMTTVY